MLAIIIPYYKRTFFEATLQSLAAQTCQDFKVYIGDDASPEDPKATLEQFQGKFNFSYHRFETNLGGTSLTQQWERCIALSDNEEWLILLGDDDVLGENVVAAFYKNLPEIEGIGCNVVRFATQVIDGEGKAISGFFEHPKLEKARDSFWRKFKGETRSSLSEYVFSRVAYSKYGFKDYPLAWHSDDMAWLEFAEEKPIFAINDGIVIITISNKSLTGKSSNLNSKNLAESMFFMDLVKHKLNFFTKELRFKFLLRTEVAIKKNRKLSIDEWKILFLKYVINFSFVPFIKFVRRFIKSLI